MLNLKKKLHKAFGLNSVLSSSDNMANLQRFLEGSLTPKHLKVSRVLNELAGRILGNGKHQKGERKREGIF